MNLLAAVALGFLLVDPDQLFDASFQLTFLAVGFLGAFAAPAIAATSGPLAAGLRDLGDSGRDLRRGAARRAVPHRDAPAGRDVARCRCGSVAVAGAGGAVGLRDRAHVGGGAARAGAAHGGLLSPAGIFRTFGERFRGAADGRGGAGGIPGGIHGLAVGGQGGGPACCGFRRRWSGSCQPGAELAGADAARVARSRAGGGADCGGDLALALGRRQ